MYLRFRAKYFNGVTGTTGYGFFWAADHLKNHGDLSISDRKELESLTKWFDNKLPIPEYYQDERNRQDAKSATSWFKDSAKLYIENMFKLKQVLDSYNVETETINRKKLPGKKIYEDEFQITVIPFRDEKKRVK